MASTALMEAATNFAREMDGWRMVQMPNGRHVWQKGKDFVPVFKGGTGGQIGLLGPHWNSQSPSTSATNYTGLTTVSAAWNATEANVKGVMPGPGPWVFGNSNLGVGFRVTMGTAPGGVASWTFNVRANGANTGITVTITGAAITASDTTHTYSFSAGDDVTIQSVPSGTPATSSNPGVEFVFEYQAANAGEHPFIECTPGSATQQAQNLTKYYTPLFDSNAIAAAQELVSATTVMPDAANLGDFYVALTNAPGGVQTVQVTIRKTVAGITTDPGTLITITGAAKTGNATGDLITVAAGDSIDIQVVTSATCASTSVRFGIRYRSTTNGNIPYVWPQCSLAQNQTQYGWGLAIRTNENLYRSAAPYACTMRNLYMLCGTGFGPASGQTFTLTGRDNAADQALTLVITGTATHNQDTTHTWTVVAGEYMDFKNVTSATSGSVLFSYGYIMQIAQPSGAVAFVERKIRGLDRGIARGVYS